MKGFVVDPALAHLDDIIGAAQPARRGAADLNVGLLADRLQLKHRVEGRDFQHADVGHAKQIGDGTDCGFRDPSIMLFLDAPQDRYRRRSLAAGWKLRDLSFRPSESFRREREVRGLYFLRCEAADGHGGSASHCMRRAADGPVKLDGRQCDHRSTSPNTISSEPRMAETSASKWSLQMKSIACRCAKPGARILHL